MGRVVVEDGLVRMQPRASGWLSSAQEGVTNLILMSSTAVTAVGGGLVESSSGLVDKSSDLVSSARESLGDMAARTVKSVGDLTMQVSRSLLLLNRSISWSLLTRV